MATGRQWREDPLPGCYSTKSVIEGTARIQGLAAHMPTARPSDGLNLKNSTTRQCAVRVTDFRVWCCLLLGRWVGFQCYEMNLGLECAGEAPAAFCAPICGKVPPCQQRLQNF